MNILIYKTAVLFVVLYGGETLSVTLREEHRPRVFDNRVLKREMEQHKFGESFIIMSFITCTLH
jgi:hypothetical protein